MALPKVSPGLLPSENYKRFNAAFDAVDAAAQTLAALAANDPQRAQAIAALQAAADYLTRTLNIETASRVIDITNSRTLVLNEVGAERALREAGDAAGSAALASEVGGRMAAVSAALDLLAAERTDRLANEASSSARPGDGQNLFTRSVNGRGSQLQPLPGELIQFGDDGYVARIAGADVVAVRRQFAVERGRRYLARFAVRRRTDTVDPANHAVRCAIAWLDQTGRQLPGSIGMQVVSDLTGLKVTDGRQQRQGTFARFGVGTQLVAPPGAAYARPYVQTYGNDGITDVEVIQISDVTDSAVVPDLSAEALSRLDAIDSQSLPGRVTQLEQATGNPLAVTYQTKAAAQAATIDPSITLVKTNGLSTAGDGLSATYKRASQAQAAADTANDPPFQSRDGAYWVFAEAISQRVGKGGVGPEAVAARGTMRAMVDWVGVGMYDATDDILKARTKSTYTGDDTIALNKVLAVQPAVQIQPLQVYLKSTVYCPINGQKLIGLGGGQAVAFNRDLGLRGDTIRFGDDSSTLLGAGSIALLDIWFTHQGRIGYTGGNLPGLLTGDEAHVRIIFGQKPSIRIGGYGARHFCVFEGGSGIVVKEGFRYGGVNDPTNPQAQEAISVFKFKYNKTFQFPKTIHLIGGNEDYGNRLSGQTYTAGDKTLTNASLAAGPLYTFLLESYEDFRSEGGFSANGRIANFAFLPQADSLICANAQISGGHHDEAGTAAILVRRDSDSAPMVEGLSVTDTSLNGQFVSKHAIYVDGSNGRFAARDVMLRGNRASAHLGTAFNLSGVDGGYAIDNRIRGSNSAVTTNNDAQYNAGTLIWGKTRNFHRNGNVYGGSANGGDLEANAMKWGAIDLTPLAADGVTSVQNNTRGSQERLAYLGTNAAGVPALGQGGGGLNLGGQAI